MRLPAACVAYMVTRMDTATLVREARHEAGLSIRALSARAGVSPATVSRIEAGRMDPTVGMLMRLLDSAGCTIELTRRTPITPPLASLADSWTSSSRGDIIDWTRLRAWLDEIALHPDETRIVILTSPAPSGSQLLDNLLAGIAETLADESGLDRPEWTNRVPALTQEWTTPGTAKIRAAARKSTPPALAARGLTLARTSLWRDRAHVR